jgi:hypothetical protein
VGWPVRIGHDGGFAENVARATATTSTWNCCTGTKAGLNGNARPAGKL